MSVRSGQPITTEFTTRAFSTGAATDATGTPTGTLFVNGTADAASVTVTNQATGRYKAAVTLPTLAIGDVVNIVITATVSGVTDSAKVWEDTKDVNLDASGNVVLQDASLVTAKLGAFALAKGTNITGLNDIAAGAAMALTSDYDAAKTALTVSAFNPPANWSAMAIAPVTGYVSANTLQVGSVDVELTNDAINANLTSILGTAISEAVAGYLAAAFEKFFNVAAPVMTTAGVNQTGDAYAVVGGLPTLAQILAGGDVDGFSLEQTLKLLLAVQVGKLSGGGTTTNVIRAADDSKTRVTATVDTSGNRTVVTLDAAG